LEKLDGILRFVAAVLAKLLQQPAFAGFAASSVTPP
jgi:hypothetical protein